MKKIISIVLASLLVMTQLVAFAAPIDNFNNAMSANYTSGELIFTAGLKLNETLAAETDYLNLNSLNNATITFRIQYDIPSKTKLKLKVEATVKQAQGEQNQESTMTYWMDLDNSAPSLTYIIQVPGDATYHYIKTKDPQVIQGMRPPFDVSRVKSIEKNIFTKNKTLIKPSYKDGTYSLTLKDADMKTITQKAIDEFYQIVAPFFMGTTSDEAKTQFATASVDVFKKLKNIPIFDKEALVLTATVDDNKLLKTVNYELNIKTDLAKVLGIITGDETFKDAKANLNATVVLDYQYNNTNQKTAISFPELTPENSKDAMEQQPVQTKEPTVDKNAINVTVDDILLALDPKPIIVNDRTLVPVRALCNSLGVDNESITFEGGIVTIYGGETNGYKTVQLTVDSSTALVNGAETALDAPAIIVNDRMFIPLRFVSQAFGHTVNFTPYEDGTGSMISITKIIPNAATVLIPSDAENADKLFEIAKAVVGVNANLVSADKESYNEKANLMLAAGEPVILYDNGKLDAITVEKMVSSGSFYTLNEALEKLVPETFKKINEDEELKKSISTVDGKIFAFPITVNDQTVRLYISSSVKDLNAAITLIDGYTKVATSMSGK